MRYLIVGICVIIFMACNNKPKNRYFQDPTSTKINSKISRLTIDTIHLDSVSSSYVGFSKIVSSSIYFFDEMFCRVYSFDQRGNFSGKYLGNGKGPNELPTNKIEAYTPLNKNRHLFIGANYDYYIFNKNWEREKSSNIDWRKKNNRKEMAKNPKPNMRGLYSPIYYKFILRENNGFLYFPIHSQHPKFNFVGSGAYYQNARIVAKMDSKTSKVKKLMGRYSPVFKKYKYLPQFSLINFDISDNGRFYVSFEPDSLIYVYNEEYTIEQVFGQEGRKMNTDYKEITTLSEFKSNYKKARRKKGFYNWIEYNDEQDLLFRNYTKGKGMNTNGLQIYQDQTLVGDVDIPKDFNKIIGSIGSYFYSNIVIDEKHENMKIYRFKVDL